MNLAHLLFAWHGRVNRAKLWLFALLAFVAWTAIVMFAYYLAGAEQVDQAGARPDPATVEKLVGNAVGPIALVLLFGLIVFYCGLAMLAKRLHDRNKSAWWLLLFVFGPAFVSGFGNAMTWSRRRSDGECLRQRIRRAGARRLSVGVRRAYGLMRPATTATGPIAGEDRLMRSVLQPRPALADLLTPARLDDGPEHRHLGHAGGAHFRRAAVDHPAHGRCRLLAPSGAVGRRLG